ncbi:Methyltransferase domain-containing protein [Streptomyces zhaozhouensis]|uniref:Methyltransferase domain-containing protein n=1 Tax=Streptomyces zhaozhouensis TaxID=1300267 RepID=A0A286DSG5_9ACTN|nr:methyltransferase domain-containing protein [Streptomyces zhaozhouensis]SOD61590.1 Methyltransferase domain-containing protein [Streptomyces zhaozhouensis]
MTAVAASPAHPWTADPYAAALRAGHGPLYLLRADGARLPLDVARWCARPDAADLSVLDRCRGEILDVGCGPGRMVAALARAARPALGIDTAPAAVARTRASGGTALLRSVFQPLPAEGRWGSALLVDGNIGIGGDPSALLRRVAAVLEPGGLLIAETAPDPVDERFEVRLAGAAGAFGEAFPWARVGPAALGALARRGGWRPVDRWTVDGRAFSALRRGAR